MRGGGSFSMTNTLLSKAKQCSHFSLFTRPPPSLSAKEKKKLPKSPTAALFLSLLEPPPPLERKRLKRKEGASERDLRLKSTKKARQEGGISYGSSPVSHLCFVRQPEMEVGAVVVVDVVGDVVVEPKLALLHSPFVS